MSISLSKFKDQTSIIMENDVLRLEVLPKGGRIVSLIDKRDNKEYLVQQKGDKYYTGPYDSNMVDYQPAGIDDMFPTINECFYEDYPWKGHKIPDHGEVWSLDWKYEIQERSIYMFVNGVRLPYRLNKWIRFSNDDEITINYRVENLSQFDMKFLWTAHPMLKAEEGMEFYLPENCSKAVCTLSISERLGEYGDTFDWPEIKDTDGKSKKLNRIRNISAGDTEKYYFKNKLKEGFCKIKYPSSGTFITLTFPEDKVPYFGILVDEGGNTDELYIIPEPCTAPFDRIDASKLFARDSIVRGDGTYEWYLTIDIKKS